jgi:hypothetical protein
MSGKPPMGAAPISVPSGSPGAQAGALAEVREAIKVLEKALPKLQPGTDVYKSILKALNDINKHVPASSEVPGVQQNVLRDLQANAGKNAMLQALGGAGGPQGAGAPSAGPPAPGAPASPGM